MTPSSQLPTNQNPCLLMQTRTQEESSKRLSIDVPQAISANGKHNDVHHHKHYHHHHSGNERVNETPSTSGIWSGETSTNGHTRRRLASSAMEKGAVGGMGSEEGNREMEEAKDFRCICTSDSQLSIVKYILEVTHCWWTIIIRHFYSTLTWGTCITALNIITPAHQGHKSFLKPSQLPGEYTAQLLPFLRI